MAPSGVTVDLHLREHGVSVMITDEAIRLRIGKEWATIRRLCQDSHRQAMVAGGFGGGVLINETPPDEIYNLPLILAYCSLDEVLTELSSQGLFRLPARSMMDRKMKMSRSALTWLDFNAVDEGRKARNELAHEAKILPKRECLRLVGLVEAELKGWGVL